MDYKQAVKWYRKAADQGDANAQYNLGAKYFTGQGVLIDIVQAYLWLNLSSANGYEKALANIKIVKNEMTTQQIAKAQRLSNIKMEEINKRKVAK